MNSTLKTIVTRALLLSIALTVAAASSPLRAQVIGDRVRLLTADESATGEIVRLSDDGFEFASDQVRSSVVGTMALARRFRHRYA